MPRRRPPFIAWPLNPHLVQAGGMALYLRALPLRRSPLASVLLLVLSLGVSLAPRSPARASAGSLLYAQHSCTAVMDAPSASAHILAQLIGGADVTLVAANLGAGTAWDEVQFWGGITGYTLATEFGAMPPPQSEEGNCTFPGLPDTTSTPLAPSTGPWPVQAEAQAQAPTSLLADPDAAAFPLGSVGVGQAVQISQWAADQSGMPWFRATTGQTVGWLPVTSVDVGTARADAGAPANDPAWQAVSGKGMWFTNYLPHHSDVNALVRAAQRAGLTHLYAEVAISQFGFYGRNSLDRLLPAAHAAGIKVVGWVYPTLTDVASDVRLTQTVATYRTPSGDQVDGVATDIEEVTTESAVYAYGQMLRTLLGPNELLVASVLHPLTHADYPYGAIGALWNVVAPMDYWHGRHDHVYTSAEVGRFLTTSLTTLRAAIGGATAIEETGQSYDMYTDDGSGGTDAPTATELRTELATVRQAGCIGASYFEWQTMTQSEWQTLSAAAW
jgi:hypothetical protein